MSVRFYFEYKWPGSALCFVDVSFSLTVFSLVGDESLFLWI